MDWNNKDEVREYNRQYREKHKEELSIKKKQYRENNKEKLAEIGKRWRKEHKDELSKKKKEYREKNKIEINKKLRQYYEEHKSEYAKKSKEYRKKNKIEIAERKKIYYENNKDKIAEYKKQYYQTNKEEISVYNKQYQRTPMGRANNLLSAYKREDKVHNRGECTLTAQWIIYNIFSQPCHYRGESDWLKIGCDRKDSSLPHTPENCVSCCFECNRKKGNKDYEEYLASIK